MCDPFPYGGCPVCDAREALDDDYYDEPDPDLYRDEQLLLADTWKDIN